jgi:DNA repair protein SbcD/Mre11
VKMFYNFLNQAVKANPQLQIIITAGNHDSASRLESPKPLLESSNIHIVGLVQKDEDGVIDYNKLVVPVKDAAGKVTALCLAIPFLRTGDYPNIAGCENPYAEGVTLLYKEAYDHALAIKEAGQAIIAMGHLHTVQAEVGDMDKQERLIMGGVECIAAAAFHKDLAYVALGHIHKAQRIGGQEHIRYCGSPLPMSFSEANYRHQVILFDLHANGIANLETVEIPVSVPLLRLPATNSRLADVLAALQTLPKAEGDRHTAPYLEVRVLADGPEPGLRHTIDQALFGKQVRLARIDLRYAQTEATGHEATLTAADQLQELQPVDVFVKAFHAKYNNAVPAELINLFNQVANEVTQSE